MSYVKQSSCTERRIYQIEPIFEPRDQASCDMVDLLLKRLQLPASGPKAARYRVMVASIVRAALGSKVWTEQEKAKPKSKRKTVMLGMAVGNDNWTQYPLVGAAVGTKVLRAFEGAGFLSLDHESGLREFYTTPNGRAAYRAIMTCWSVSPSFRRLLKTASPLFQETGLPLVTVSDVETRAQRSLRIQRNGVKDLLSQVEQVRLFGADKVDHQSARVKALVDYWRKHPLVFPDGNATSCATRKFSDRSLRVGGRLYGAWTNLPNADRLKCTIDGEPVLQLDISASQPTLLSVLLGIKLSNLSEADGWHDPYTHLNGLWSYGFTSGQSEEERKTASDRARRIAKAVLLELIGTGNVDKAHPSQELVQDWSVTQEEWDYFKTKLREAIPALEKLEPRYDAKGNPTGYLNGAGFLTFHESEIMLQTLENLRDQWDIPAYPIHDCLLVKASDWEPAYVVFVQTISDYVEVLTGGKVIVPISREGGGLPKASFRGVYSTRDPQHLFL